MATSQMIRLDPQDTGLWKVKQTDEAAKKTAELLQDDLKASNSLVLVAFANADWPFHILEPSRLLQRSGFPQPCKSTLQWPAVAGPAVPSTVTNSLPHQLVHQALSLFGTGASPTAIQQAYETHSPYQRTALAKHDEVVTQLFQTWDHASAYLGNEKHYPDFLAFFQREIDAKGWQPVLSEYLFAGTPSADDLLIRLFAGILHPLIQLMYGLEWKQPALVAEGLAQACVHQPDFADFLRAAERNAQDAYASTHDATSTKTMPHIVTLHEEARADSKLAAAVEHVNDMGGPRFADSVLVRAKDEMLRVVSRVKVWPEEVDERTAEMFHAEMYMAASAALRGPQLGKHPKFDFFLM